MQQQVVFRVEWIAASASALLLILSFPKFELYYLAWIALVPLLVGIARRPEPGKAFLISWAFGSVFFYASCYWLTYSMIHYGGLPAVLAYLLLIPGALVVGLFPGIFGLLMALAIRRWGYLALLLAPIFWTTLEWARLQVTGQLWNAIGYSQAFHPFLIQSANWGGVYAVSFLIVAINAAVALFVTALLVMEIRPRTIVPSLLVVALVGFTILISPIMSSMPNISSDRLNVNVVALQPNVPMTLVKTPAEMKELLERHLTLSTNSLKSINWEGPRFVIWPESPMNFTYASDRQFQELVASFTRESKTSLLFNSLEPANAHGSYNSALLINEEGRMISQYDKIRLMPFGEYVPLPQWLPGASLITGMVGEFTPGSNYTLMPFGEDRAGVFICIESAYPWIARRLTNEGADVLINISNDGYLGPTAVMRQHLANAIFRAVENGRQVLRVTNTGITARIDERGKILDRTSGFQIDARVWSVPPDMQSQTAYTKHGDRFVHVCAVISLLILMGVLFNRPRIHTN